jgi:hypothetical protein
MRRSRMMWMRMMMRRAMAAYPLLDGQTVIGDDPRVFLRQLLDDGWGWGGGGVRPRMYVCGGEGREEREKEGMDVLTGINRSGKAERRGMGVEGRALIEVAASRAVTGERVVAASAGEVCTFGACPISCSLSTSRGDRMGEEKKREKVTHQRGWSRGGKHWCWAGWPSS